MSFLLDTTVLSETRKQRRDPGVTEWISRTAAERLHVSVLTIGEIGHGVAALQHRGDYEQVAVFERWLDDVVESFEDRIAPVTVEVAREWGARSIAHPVSTIGGLIAATARVHGWTVVTRNVKDFEHAGVRLLNPFTG